MKLALATAGLLAAFPWAVFAQTVVAARTIRSHAILTEADLVLADTGTKGGFSDIADLIGLEARVTLYQGRPIAASDVGPAAIIERNQIVTMIFANGALTIKADARALGRAGIGDDVRVMNLASRKTVFGTVGADGEVYVGTPPPAARE